MAKNILRKRLTKEVKTFNNEELERLNELLPAVKTAYWWDHSGLMGLINAQLKYMSKNWCNATYENSEVQENELKEAVRLSNLLLEDNFMDKYHDILDKKYGEIRITKNGISREFETPACNAETFEYLNKAKQEKQKVKTEFFEILKKYEDWWD